MPRTTSDPALRLGALAATCAVVATFAAALVTHPPSTATAAGGHTLVLVIPMEVH